MTTSPRRERCLLKPRSYSNVVRNERRSFEPVVFEQSLKEEKQSKPNESLHLYIEDTGMLLLPE